LKREVCREPLTIAFERFVDSTGWHSIKPRKIGVENGSVAANREDQRLQRLFGCAALPGRHGTWLSSREKTRQWSGR
jgi:hypothetical protein